MYSVQIHGMTNQNIFSINRVLFIFLIVLERNLIENIIIF